MINSSILLTLFSLFILSCFKQNNSNTTLTEISNNKESLNQDSLEIMEFFTNHHTPKEASESIGTVAEGKLKHGKLIPFYGENYTYFDKDSYLASRAFTHEKIYSIILDSYADLLETHPNRKFFLMELSRKEGGEIFPHRTHQNGLSVDFMMPKLKNGLPCYTLDSLGKSHYLLEFNDQGEYVEDTSIKIDFDLVAEHILALNKNANKLGYKIQKVIIKVSLKDELFKTSHGQKLKNSSIYIVKSLTPLINNLHDDHYHIDFQKI